MGVMDDGVSDSSSDAPTPQKSQSSRTQQGKTSRGFFSSKNAMVTQPPMPPKQPPNEVTVFPPAITFPSVKPNLLYALTFQYTNTAKRNRRIRILPPSSPHFKLLYEVKGDLASGLTATAEVEFQMTDDDKEQESYTDSITVVSENTRVVIPLTALRPSPQITFDSLCNLGFCAVGAPVSKRVSLINEGSKEGKFKINYKENAGIKITPSEGVLGPGKKHVDLDGDGRMEGDEVTNVTDGSNKMDVTIDFEGSELGPFRSIAEVVTEGGESKIFDISAQVVEQSLELVHVDNGGALGETLSFGSLIYGQTKTVQALLVNNGPQSISYTLHTELDKTTMEDMDRADGANDDSSFDAGDDAASETGTNATDDDDPIFKTITATPTEGIIEPYAQLPVDFTFSPNLPKKQRGFGANKAGPENAPARNFAVKVSVEGSEIKAGKELTLACTGKAVRPNIEISQKCLRFGECPVYERRDILLTIKNTSELKLPYSFGKLPNFQARPPKGVLLPMQSQSCVVSFAPGQMGERKALMNLSIAQGLTTIPIRCMGQATAPKKGAKKTLVGGPNMIPGDFRPQFNFVKSEKASEKKTRKETNKFVRPQPWEDVDLNVSSAWDESKLGPNDSAEVKNTFSVQKLAEIADHKKKYDTFLTKAREERQMKATKKKEQKFASKFGSGNFDPFGPNLGMINDPADDPIPALPQSNEPLWLQRPLDGSQATGSGSRMPADENRLITKKFKPQPTTQAEVRDCAQELSSQELLAVSGSHKVIDFGELVVNSTKAKNFAISNDLPRCVLVSLGKLEPELEQSSPASQVIPSGATAGFDIKFSTPHEGKFKKTVHWVVNGKHTFKFTILAMVVPVRIDLNTSELNMNFSENSLESSMSELITLENPGNAPAEYSWTSRRAFQVKPDSGTIPPFSSTECEVTWSPSPSYKNSEVLSLHVPGGEDVDLKIVGNLQDAKCSFAQKELNCGTLAVGIESTHVVKLKNTGKNPAVVFADSFPDGSGISCKPEKVRIPVGALQEFTLTIKPPMPRKYTDIGFSVMVRGGKILRCAINAEAVVPNVTLEQSNFDFGKVVIGGNIRLPLTLKNEGDIAGCLTMDMSKYPNFSLQEPKKKIMTSMAGQFAPDGTASTTINSLDPVYKSGKDDEDCHLWKITIDSNSVFEIELMYKPTSANSHDFGLPLNFQGIQSDVSLRRQVTATGLKPKLLMSTTNVDFEDRVVQRDPSRRMPYTSELTFTNDSQEGLAWEIDDSSTRPVSTGVGGNITSTSIWFVSPKRGTLSPGEVVTLRVTFSPQEDVDYEAELPCYLQNQEDTSRPYLVLSLNGSGVYPRIVFDCQEILLPAVPLNVESRALFHVANDGYDSLDLTHKLPINCQVPVEVEFPKGKSIGLGTDKIPVIVSFKSEKAISLHTKIDFFDADGSCYSIKVTGCSDNSIFTNYSFLQTYADNYRYFAMEANPVCYYDKKQVLAMQQFEHKRKEVDRARKRRQSEIEMNELAKAGGQIPQSNAKSKSNRRGSQQQKEAEAAAASKKKEPKIPPLTVSSLLEQTEAGEQAGVNIEEPAYLLPSEEVDSLKFWLNCNVMLNPIANFPGDFLDTDGKAGIDAIEFMCGKKIPGKIRKLTSVKGDQLGQLLGQYKELLVFMKSHGALLPGVKAENFLQRSQFVAAREAEAISGPTRVTAAQLKQSKLAWESKHATTAKESWACLMFQAIRVFMLGRVTPAGLSKLPGVLLPATKKGKDGGKTIDSELEGSNIYSLGECTLLKWVGYHVNKNLGGGMKKRIINFDSDFADGSVYCSLLANHLPFLTEEGGLLSDFVKCNEVEKLQKSEVRTANMKIVVDVLKKCRIEMGATMENLLNPTTRQTVLFMLNLYQALPQLIPKTTIDFNCVLGDSQKKSIALTNPSNKPVTYAVTLEGNSDFSMESDSVSLDPKSVTQFIVTATPRFSKPVTARITFWAQRDSGPMASNLVFLLKSTVTKLKATDTYNVEARCYEPTSVEIIVKNPYEQSCVLLTELQQELIAPYLLVPPGMSKSSGISMPLPSQIFGSALARQKSKKRVGTAASSLRGVGGDKKDDAEAIAQDIEDREKCLKILGSPFHVESTKLKMNPGDENKITVQVLAFVPGTYRAYVIFLDEKVGQFAYEVVLNCGLPKPSAELEMDVTAEEEENEKILRLPQRNGQLDKAASIALDRLPSAMRTRCRNILLSYVAPHAPEGAPNGLLRYRCMFDSPFYQAIPDVIMRGNEIVAIAPGTGGGGEEKKEEGGGEVEKKKKLPNLPKNVILEDCEGDKPLSNFLMINFFPKEAGAYPLTITLMPFSGECDVRIFKINSSVTTKPKETNLTFVAPARQVVVQEIPIQNNGSEDWTLNCAIAGSRSFSGSNSFKVPANSTANYPLTFKPQWICEEEGTLTMKNAKVGNSFAFTLTGRGDEPLADGHFQIPMKAREVLEQEFAVPGNGKFSVESDLPYVSGPPTIDCDGGNNVYKLKIAPQASGNFTGQITFKNEASGQYFWYTCEITVSAPAEEASISIEAVCRTAAAATISLSNPTESSIVFAVRLDGEGLIGDPTFTLQPNSTSSYELFYSPLVARKHQGTVAFTNPQAGEFWYKLELSAISAPPEKLERLSAPVGGKTRKSITIQNPLGKEIKMGSSVMNKRNFAVEPAGIILKPYGETTFDIVYTPSSLGEDETTKVEVTHPEIGDYVYYCSGRGELPGVMEEHYPTAVVNDQTSYPFKFKNPFNAVLTVDLILHVDEGGEVDENNGAVTSGAIGKNIPGSPSQDSFASGGSEKSALIGQETFKLLPKKTREIVMAPLTSIQIPISFAPDTIEEKHAQVEVRGELGQRKLTWLYPIRGLAESPPGRTIVLSTPAKTPLREDVELVLYGLSEEALGENEEFGFELEWSSATEYQRRLMESTTKVIGSKLTLNGVDDYLGFKILFEPLRPFTCSSELVITRKSTGGRWKFPIRVDATDAEPEQEIEIEAAIMTVSKVVFKLTNRTQEPAEFQAFFTVDSANTLSIEPSGGVLGGYGTDGTQLGITYAPQEYGKSEKGRLIIMTDEVQWIYDVVTRHPGFQPPQGVASKLDSRLDPHLEKSLGTSKISKINVIAHNMKGENMNASKLRNDKARDKFRFENSTDLPPRP